MFRHLDHHAVDFGFEETRRAEPVVHVEAVDAEKHKRSALRPRRVSSAMGPTSENEFLRRVPAVRITSTAVPASSAAMLTALVMMVRF